LMSIRAAPSSAISLPSATPKPPSTVRPSRGSPGRFFGAFPILLHSRGRGRSGSQRHVMCATPSGQMLRNSSRNPREEKSWPSIFP
jgi:hypothetical protein